MGAMSRPGLGAQYGVNVQRARIVLGMSAPFVDYPLEGVDDVDKRSASRQERLDALFVGRVEDRREARTRHAHPSGQGDGGEGLLVQREEVPGRGPRPVTRAG